MIFIKGDSATGSASTIAVLGTVKTLAVVGVTLIAAIADSAARVVETAGDARVHIRLCAHTRAAQF